MSSRKLGELLLRPPPIRSFAPLQQTSSPAWHLSPSPACLAQRTFTTSAHVYAAEQPPKTPHETLRKNVSAEETDARPLDRQPARSQNAETSQAIDSLFFGRLKQRTSADDFSAARRQYKFGEGFSRPNANPRPPRLSLDDMHLPEPLSDVPGQPQTTALQEKDIVYPRLNPSTGRTVKLDPKKGRDIVRGLGMLASLMARNQVKRDFNKQRFHERPGLKRKRLKSERWRARFKTEFQATCKRVTELTRKGW